MFARSKVSIIGPGAVGMAIAYTLLTRQLAGEIVLVGRDQTKAKGEANDLRHAHTFLNAAVKVNATDMSGIVGSDVVVMCASVPAPEGFNDRNTIAKGNIRLQRKLLPEVSRYAPEAILLMVSNPVDALTWMATELTGFPAHRVIGTGTLVDSMRFRALISEQIRIHPDDLRAYILGEHGDHQFPAMSIAYAGGDRIDDTPERRALAEKAKWSGIEVFQMKGNTSYAIGMATVYVIESILLDECRTIPLSVKIDGYLGVSDVCLSLPVVVGRNGVERCLLPQLSDEECEAFRAAAGAVRNMIQQMHSWTE